MPSPVLPAESYRQNLAAEMSHFTENLGQAGNPAIRLYGSSPGYSVGFAVRHVDIVLVESAPRPMIDESVPPAFGTVSASGVVVRTTFAASNPVEPVGRGELSPRNHYFLGNDPMSWRTNVRNYREVVYPGLYDGIDLVYRATGSGLKYEFQLAAGADPRAIRADVEGVHALSVGDHGLVHRMALGELRDSTPISFQNDVPIHCRFELLAPTSYGFACEGWDVSSPGFLDPLLYATFLGGTADEQLEDIVVDAGGNVYLAGATNSLDFPITPGAFSRRMRGVGDAIVASFDSTGNLRFATYLGGTREVWSDTATGIALGSSGDIVLTGHTNASDFPISPDALDPTHNDVSPCQYIGCMDGFLTRLDPNGSTLLYSTYFGGSSQDLPESLRIDSLGDWYLAGNTVSQNFPTTSGAYDRTPNGGYDAWVAKFAASGALVFSTLLGGFAYEWHVSMDVASDGSAFVAGQTASFDFPMTAGAFDTTYGGGGDLFLARVAPGGGALVYSTFLGGSNTDDWVSVAVDAYGSAHLSGMTESTDFPVTSGAFDGSLDGLTDAFAVRVAADGTSLLWATMLGGSGLEGCRSIAVDSDGSVYVAGTTNSTDFPVTTYAHDGTPNGEFDAFVTRLNAQGAALVNSTYLGGSRSDYAWSMALGRDDTVYLVGDTSSPDFPVTTGAFDTTLEGTSDGFLAMPVLAAPDLSVDPDDVAVDPSSPVTVGDLVVVSATVRNLGTAATWDVSVRFLDGLTGGNRIGLDQAIPFIAANGSGRSSVSWMASPSGLHDLCVIADPDNDIGEINESNNEACVSLLVIGAAEERPDYAPAAPDPMASVRVGTLAVLPLSLHVFNEGNGSADRATVLAFIDASSPSLPFASFDVPPLGPGDTSARFAASWQAPAVAGLYTIVADVDFGGQLPEWNETNNEHAWVVEVVLGPITSLVVGEPNYAAPTTYVTSGTPFSLSVVDRSGAGIRSTRYWIDVGPWTEYAGPFTLSGEGEHFVEWHSEDELGNVEPPEFAFFRVDDTPPATSSLVGSPHLARDDLFVTSITPIGLGATDGGAVPVGVAQSEYRVDGGPWQSYEIPFVVTSEGLHEIDYRSGDLLGNIELARTVAVLVDDSGPTTRVVVGDPKYVAESLFVTSRTEFSLSAADGGAIPVGVAQSEYRVDEGPWQAYTIPFSLVMQGLHEIDYRSTDLLGNTELIRTVSVLVDDAPPMTRVAVGDPKYATEDMFVTSRTPFSLSATDGGFAPAGVARTEYRSQGDMWRVYSEPLFLSGEGEALLEVRSTDLLGNEEPIRGVRVIVDDTPPRTLPSLRNGTHPPATPLALVASDSGSGVALTEVRLDGGPWATYENALALSEGHHTIGFRSTDRVGNVEGEGTISLTIEAGPIVGPGMNWKPVIAAAFAAVIALVGAWAARRAPWPNGTRSALRAFTLVALPFIVAEVLTGAVSLLTGLLAIPPVLGPGLFVDLAILVGGIVVSTVRVRKRS